MHRYFQLQRITPLFALVVVFLSTLVVDAAPLKLIIDPGHGGHDKGATRGSAREATIVLQIANELKKLVDQDERFSAKLTRDTDDFIPLNRRTEIAEQNKSDLFLSIHANSSPDTHHQGVEFYFQNQMAPDEESLFLASRENSDENLISNETKRDLASEKISVKGDLKQILEDLKRNYKVEASSELSRAFLDEWPKEQLVGHSRWIRQAPFFVISQTTMPSVLVEVGFVTNAEESVKLTQGNYQREVAHNLYRALVKFKETIDKDHTHL